MVPTTVRRASQPLGKQGVPQPAELRIPGRPSAAHEWLAATAAFLRCCHGVPIEVAECMFRVLVDTSVWLDLAKDRRDEPIISALEALIRARRVSLIVPQIVVDEFERNRARVVSEARRSLQSHFRLVREAVSRFGDSEYKTATIKGLEEIDHKIITTDETVLSSIDRIDKLLKAQPAIGISNKLKKRVTERALASLPPYHRDKNSVGDAVLVETYSEAISGRARRETRFAFVTHNSRDFSEPNGDRRKPHPGLANLFQAPRSTYWASMADLLNEIDPSILQDDEAELFHQSEPRRLSEILEAENLLFKQVWYTRHRHLRADVEEGLTKVVPESELSRKPYRCDQILDSVWEAALAAAKRTEEEVGTENLGPWDDFE